MLDRLSTGIVTLPSNTYDLVLILTDSDGSRRAEALQLLTRDVYTALVPAMKSGGKLQTEDNALNASEAMEAVLAGLVQNATGFEKPNYEQASAVPLKFGLKKKKKTPAAAPVQAPPMGIQFGSGFALDGMNGSNHDRDDNDELINEDSLLNEEDLTRPIMPRKFAPLLLEQSPWLFDSCTDILLQPQSASPRPAAGGRPARTVLAGWPTDSRRRIRSVARTLIRV